MLQLKQQTQQQPVTDTESDLEHFKDHFHILRVKQLINKLIDKVSCSPYIRVTSVTDICPQYDSSIILTAYSLKGRGSAGVYHSCHWARGVVPLRQVYHT